MATLVFAGIFVVAFGVAGFLIFFGAGGIGGVDGAEGVVDDAVFLFVVFDESAGLGVGRFRFSADAEVRCGGDGMRWEKGLPLKQLLEPIEVSWLFFSQQRALQRVEMDAAFERRLPIRNIEQGQMPA